MSDGVSRLFEAGREMVLARGAHLFLTGDVVERMFLLRSGRLDLVRHDAEGTPQVLHRARAGQVVSEASAYVVAYHCDGRIMEDAQVLAVPRSLFLQRLAGDAGLAEAWAKRLAGALQRARLVAEIRGLRRVSDKLDTWLAGGGEIPPRGQRQELAEVIGVTREALYRELARRGG